MNYRFLFAFNAILLAAAGVWFALFPQAALSMFGTEAYTATLFVARFFGFTMLLSGVFLWMLREIVNAKAEKRIAYILMACSVLGFFMTIIGMTAVGVIRANGWVLLVVYGALALVYGYLLFLAPKEAKPRASRKPAKSLSSPGSTPGISMQE